MQSTGTHIGETHDSSTMLAMAHHADKISRWGSRNTLKKEARNIVETGEVETSS